MKNIDLREFDQAGRISRDCSSRSPSPKRWKNYIMSFFWWEYRVEEGERGSLWVQQPLRFREKTWHVNYDPWFDAQSDTNWITAVFEKTEISSRTGDPDAADRRLPSSGLNAAGEGGVIRPCLPKRPRDGVLAPQQTKSMALCWLDAQQAPKLIKESLVNGGRLTGTATARGTKQRGLLQGATCRTMCFAQ